jgi:membrane protein
MASPVERLKSSWRGLRSAHSSVDVASSSWTRLGETNGNLYAGAITYFSFLALFPLLLLAASVTGYVLYNDPGLQRSLFSHITDAIPGSFGTTVKDSVQKSINNRTGVGLVGLVGVLLTGLGWIGNLRQALDAVWGRKPPKRNFLTSRLSNLFVLIGLGLGIVVSLGLTVIGTSLTSQILSTLGLDSLPGSTILLKVVGIAVAALADVIIFWWVLVKIPEQNVERSVAFRGALMASVGFEVLKIVGTYTIAHTANSPTAGPFASILAVLIWIQLVARFMLFACAWTAVLTAEERQLVSADTVPVIEPEAVEDVAAPPSAITPAAVGVALVGAGAVAGAAATLAVTRAYGERSQSSR